MQMATCTPWTMTDSERQLVVSRSATIIAGIRHDQGTPISKKVALAAAVAVEKDAHATAKVAATNTTGMRPAREVANIYDR